MQITSAIEAPRSQRQKRRLADRFARTGATPASDASGCRSRAEDGPLSISAWNPMKGLNRCILADVTGRCSGWFSGVPAHRIRSTGRQLPETSKTHSDPVDPPADWAPPPKIGAFLVQSQAAADPAGLFGNHVALPLVASAAALIRCG